MVAFLAHRNDENVIQIIIQDGSISGDGTIVDTCGINSNGLGR